MKKTNARAQNARFQNALNLTLRILVRQHEDGWEAQALDFDVAAQGAELRDALYEVQRTFFAEMVVNVEQGFHPLHAMSPAPDFFWKAFETSAQLKDAVVPRLSSDSVLVGSITSDVREVRREAA